MNKKYLVILLLLFLLWLWSKRGKAQAPAPPVTPATTPEEKPEYYTVVAGDSIWKIAKRRLPEGSSNSLIFAYVVQISRDNGKNPDLIDGILTPGVNDPDLIYPGDILKIYPYKP